jgi:hypothetical protein
VSLRQTISHGFPVVVQIDVAPELPRAEALIDARPAAVAAQAVDAPEPVAAAACIDVPAAVVEAAYRTAAADCAAALSVSTAAYPHYSNALPVRAAADDRHVSD